jgi:acyl-CoA synthetase (AMP-forming)/AMP-acid ligase II
MIMPNDGRFIVTWMAIARLGAIAVPMSTLATPAQLARIARDADLHLLIAVRRYLKHDYVARLEEALPGLSAQRGTLRLLDAPYLRAVWFWSEQVPQWACSVDSIDPPEVTSELLAQIESGVHSSDVASFIYTSGSSGAPKGVIHSHGNFMRQSAKLAAVYRYTRDERAYASMPVFWVGGLTVSMFSIIQVGGALLATPSKDAELLDFLEAQRVTSVVAWPRVLRALAALPGFHSRDWSSMRGGALYEALPPSLRLRDPSLMALALGMTETNGPYTIPERQLPEHQRGSCGPLMPGIDVRLVRKGESKDDLHVLPLGASEGIFQVRSDVMMLGFVKRERADVFDADGWYTTGDVCRLHGNYVHFIGRADRMFKVSDANVNPGDVEEILKSLSGIGNAHVCGVPDKKKGYVVGAWIVAKPGAQLDADSIKRGVAQCLEQYKVPNVIVFRTEPPMLDSDKPDYQQIMQALIEEKRRQEGGA